MKPRVGQGPGGWGCGSPRGADSAGAGATKVASGASGDGSGFDGARRFRGWGVTLQCTPSIRQSGRGMRPRRGSAASSAAISGSRSRASRCDRLAAAPGIRRSSQRAPRGSTGGRRGGRRGDRVGWGAGFGAVRRGGGSGVAATARKRAEMSRRRFQMAISSGAESRRRLPCSATQLASHAMMAARRSAGVAGRVADMGGGRNGRAGGLRFGEARERGLLALCPGKQSVGRNERAGRHGIEGRSGPPMAALRRCR